MILVFKYPRLDTTLANYKEVDITSGSRILAVFSELAKREKVFAPRLQGVKIVKMFRLGPQSDSCEY